jgi:acyl-CoA thioesterase I
VTAFVSLTRRLLLVAALSVAIPLARPAAGAERVIVAFGDSLTAGLGVAAHEAWPALLDARLRRDGYPYRVVNAGVSGDTTAGGVRRVDWVLRAAPAIVIVELGANDGLRGLPVDTMRANLDTIVRRLQGAGVRVLLTGMRVPPNYGAAYARDFSDAFAQVAKATGAPFMPFLLEGVAADAALNQPDGIHPTAAGHAVIAERLWPYVRRLVTR